MCAQPLALSCQDRSQSTQKQKQRGAHQPGERRHRLAASDSPLSVRAVRVSGRQHSGFQDYAFHSRRPHGAQRSAGGPWRHHSVAHGPLAAARPGPQLPQPTALHYDARLHRISRAVCDSQAIRGPSTGTGAAHTLLPRRFYLRWIFMQGGALRGTGQHDAAVGETAGGRQDTVLQWRQQSTDAASLPEAFRQHLLLLSGGGCAGGDGLGSLPAAVQQRQDDRPGPARGS
ncbi:uncharacterized protein LOC126412900 [Schistocerca serialis cubense]|uniref:uncharacterized protein LOC126412900 n=1 Tax=Schistocerca serialis cubense TaxID=2023355 RepID=UPI00214E6113|nr:uncharacterized protein LOC126412900 [Schistocerca serialis cubense]